MIEVLEDIAAGRASRRSADFKIYKSLIHQMINGEKLSATEIEELNNVARVLAIPFEQIDNTVREIKELAAICEDIEAEAAAKFLEAEAAVTKYQADTKSQVEKAKAMLRSRVFTGQANVDECEQGQLSIDRIAYKRQAGYDR